MGNMSPRRITQKIGNRVRSSKNKKVGNKVEEIALIRLQFLGVQMASPVNDKWVPVKPVAGGWMCYKGKGKLPGDVWGCLHGGQMVLCECKWRTAKEGKEARLLWSDLEEHQIENLNKARCLGAVPILFWHSGAYTYTLPWPIAQFTSGTSLRHDVAAELDIKTERDLMRYAKRCQEDRTQSQYLLGDE